MVFGLIFLGVLLVQVGVYALWNSYRTAGDRVQLRADTIATRARADAGHYIGGSDRPGSN